MANIGVAMVGGNGVRAENDFYQTPPEATLALLPLIKHWPEYIWEPACGNGAISEVLKENGYSVWSTDLVNRGYGRVEDFLTAHRFGTTVVTNPPFNLADQFILHAKAIGITHMALLLKATFWHAAKRKALWSEWRPSRIFPLTWRLDFDGRGAPTMDCMWCIWEPQRVPVPTGYFPLPRPVSVEEMLG